MNSSAYVCEYHSSVYKVSHVAFYPPNIQRDQPLWQRKALKLRQRALSDGKEWTQVSNPGFLNVEKWKHLSCSLTRNVQIILHLKNYRYEFLNICYILQLLSSRVLPPGSLFRKYDCNGLNCGPQTEAFTS